MRRVAVVGSGISGLTVAYRLATEAQVTLFEAGGHFGGHTHTVDVTLDGVSRGVDAGFLVFNHRTYPNLVRLFSELGIQSEPSEMSFSVQCPGERFEWGGADLNAVFAQRRNLLKPRFLGMLAEVLRFNRLATRLATGGGGPELELPIGDFLARHRFGGAFREDYFLPMIGCIWSCPTEQMLHFPVATMLRFCHNHGLLQLAGRPQWHTVAGGARHYVQRMLERVADARLNCPVHAVCRLPPGAGQAGVRVDSAAGSERFDDVVLACHSDQSLALLTDADPEERTVLGAVRYQPNRVVLHTDASLLPRSPRAWAAWNYERAAATDRVCVHYLINRLQPLPWRQPVIVSLNPVRDPDAARVLGQWDASHPVFDAAAIAAQRRLPALQGRSHLWFCGAWARYGFHEDGLVSALDVVERWRARRRAGMLDAAA